MEGIRIKYARERLRLAREGLLEAAEEANRRPKDREVGDRLDRSLDLYRSARDEVRRIEQEKQQ